jgi:hypothetical protein
MIKQIGEGTKLDDMSEARGGLKGFCGSVNACNVCGDRNGSDIAGLIRYEQWKEYDF